MGHSSLELKEMNELKKDDLYLNYQLLGPDQWLL